MTVLSSDIAAVRAWVASALAAQMDADAAAPVARELGMGPRSNEMEFLAGGQLVTVSPAPASFGE